MRNRIPPGQREPFGDRQQPGQPRAYDPSVQADVSENLRYRGELRPGTVPVDIEVLSVFDSRPVNASDFLVLTPPGGVDLPGGFQTDVLSVTVPAGRLLVLRRVRWRVYVSAGVPGYGLIGWTYAGVSLQYSFAPPWTFRLTINRNIPDALALNSIDPFQGPFGRADLFLLVDEGETVTFTRITGAGGEADRGFAEFHGTMLLKRGLPKVFEIGHEGRAARERKGVVL